ETTTPHAEDALDLVQEGARVVGGSHPIELVDADEDRHVDGRDGALAGERRRDALEEAAEVIDDLRIRERLPRLAGGARDVDAADRSAHLVGPGLQVADVVQ